MADKDDFARLWQRLIEDHRLQHCAKQAAIDIYDIARSWEGEGILGAESLRETAIKTFTRKIVEAFEESVDFDSRVDGEAEA